MIIARETGVGGWSNAWLELITFITFIIRHVKRIDSIKTKEESFARSTLRLKVSICSADWLGMAMQIAHWPIALEHPPIGVKQVRESAKLSSNQVDVLAKMLAKM